MKVRLTKRLAECIDGVDLSGRSVGDILELSLRDARLLLLEQWAESTEPATSPDPPHLQPAADVFADLTVVLSAPRIDD